MKIPSGFLLGLLAAGLFAGSAFAVTVPVAEDTFTSPTKTGTDVIDAGSGAEATLPVTDKETTLIQFDLENLDAVPATITDLNINSAILQVYVVSAAPAGELTIHAVDSVWSEHFAGKTAPAPVIDPTVLATIPGSEIGKKDFVTVDVTAAVKAALVSGSFDGFAIETTGTTKVELSSKEGPASGYAAQLFIDAGNGPLANSDTAIGAGALSAIASLDAASAQFGVKNTAYGNGAMQNEATGSFNSAFGFGAMQNDEAGASNTAFGFNALGSGTNNVSNTAIGQDALSQVQTTFAQHNTALGVRSLGEDQNGGFNVAVGDNALFSSTTGASNVAVGASALFKNQGNSNTCVGFDAYSSGTAGSNNTVVGREALNGSTSGNGNVALGYRAGVNNQTGNNNVYLGDADSSGNSSDTASESNTIRIGAPDQHTATFIAGIVGDTTGSNDAVEVVIDSNGQLGTINSSRRYKEDIHDMGDASARLLSLRPVTFRYKKPYADGGKPIQYGLIAEEVAQVFPELVVRNAQGQPETVKYQLLAPLLLNEFLKEHKQVEAQAQVNAAQAQTIAAQQKQIEALTASMQKVTHQMDAVAQRLDGKDFEPVVNRMRSVPNE
jgi:hypothetical protein